MANSTKAGRLEGLSFAALKEEAGKHNIRRNLSATNLRSALRLVRNGERVPPGWLVAGSSLPLQVKNGARQGSTGAASLASSIRSAKEESEGQERRVLAQLPQRAQGAARDGSGPSKVGEGIKSAKAGASAGRTGILSAAAGKVSAGEPKAQNGGIPRPTSSNLVSSTRPRNFSQAQSRPAPSTISTAATTQMQPASAPSIVDSINGLLRGLTQEQIGRVSALVRRMVEQPSLIDVAELAISESNRPAAFEEPSQPLDAAQQPLAEPQPTEAIPPVTDAEAEVSVNDSAAISKTSTPKVPRASNEEPAVSPMPDASQHDSIVIVGEHSTSLASLASPPGEPQVSASTPEAQGASRIRRLSDIEEESSLPDERQPKRARKETPRSAPRRSPLPDESLLNSPTVRRTSPRQSGDKKRIGSASPRRAASIQQTMAHPLQPIAPGLALPVSTMWTAPSTNVFRAVLSNADQQKPATPPKSSPRPMEPSPLAAPSYFGSEGQYGTVDSRFADEMPAAAWEGPKGWLQGR